MKEYFLSLESYFVYFIRSLMFLINYVHGLLLLHSDIVNHVVNVTATSAEQAAAQQSTVNSQLTIKVKKHTSPKFPSFW